MFQPMEVSESERNQILRQRLGLDEHSGKIAGSAVSDQMAGAQQLGIQSGRISASGVMLQKAMQMRKQADALQTIGRQLQEIEKRQSTEVRMGADLTDALMTVFR